MHLATPSDIQYINPAMCHEDVWEAPWLSGDLRYLRDRLGNFSELLGQWRDDQQILLRDRRVSDFRRLNGGLPPDGWTPG